MALGIGIDGVKQPLALVEGSTENATLVTDLLVDLRDVQEDQDDVVRDGEDPLDQPLPT